MNIETDPNQRSPMLSIKVESPVVGVISRLLSGVKPYKEVIMLLITIGGGGLALSDYFATSFEVRVLRCRHDIKIEMLRNQMDIESMRGLTNGPPTALSTPLRKVSLSSLTAAEKKKGSESMEAGLLARKYENASMAVDEAKKRLESSNYCESVARKKD